MRSRPTPPPPPSGPSFPWNPVLALVGLLAMAAVLGLPHGPEHVAVSRTEAPPADGGLSPADSFPPALGVPMRGPLPGQKKPPCKPKGAPGLPEKEVEGACWYPVQGTPPCGEGYDYEGACYLPVPVRLKVPSSFEE